MLLRYTKHVRLAQASIIGSNLYYLCFVMWLRYQTILLGGYITHKALEDATRIRSAYPHITIYLGVELAHRMWLVHLNLPYGTWEAGLYSVSTPLSIRNSVWGVRVRIRNDECCISASLATLRIYKIFVCKNFSNRREDGYLWVCTEQHNVRNWRNNWFNQFLYSA